MCYSSVFSSSVALLPVLLFICRLLQYQRVPHRSRRRRRRRKRQQRRTFIIKYAARENGKRKGKIHFFEIHFCLINEDYIRRFHSCSVILLCCAVCTCCDGFIRILYVSVSFAICFAFFLAYFAVFFRNSLLNKLLYPSLCYA